VEGSGEAQPQSLKSAGSKTRRNITTWDLVFTGRVDEGGDHKNRGSHEKAMDAMQCENSLPRTGFNTIKTRKRDEKRRKNRQDSPEKARHAELVLTPGQYDKKSKKEKRGGKKRLAYYDEEKGEVQDKKGNTCTWAMGMTE